MALRNIVKIGDSILAKKSRPVENFDIKLFSLLQDMTDTMYKENGLGLAAVQVGVLKRVVVLNTGDGLIELINPEIISQEGVQEAIEGCLSLPGRTGVTKRPASVKVKAQDRFGKWHIYKGEGIKARCFCHEIDHLDGIVFTEHVIRQPTPEDENAANI